MSDLKFACPHCEQKIGAPEDMMGEIVDCPTCKGKIQLPKSQTDGPHPRRHRSAEGGKNDDTGLRAFLSGIKSRLAKILWPPWNLQDYLNDGAAKTHQPSKGPLDETIIDYRSVDEVRLQHRAQRPLRGDDESVVMELLNLQSGVAWPLRIDKDDQALNRIRELGGILYGNGGHWRMVVVAYRFKALGGTSRMLDYEWNGIGAWRD